MESFGLSQDDTQAHKVGERISKGQLANPGLRGNCH